jgi:serine/threonine protein kinase
MAAVVTQGKEPAAAPAGDKPVAAGDYESDFDRDDEEAEEESDDVTSVEDNEEEEEESEDDDDADDDEEEEEEEEDDEDADEGFVDPLVLKVQKDGDKRWSILRVANDVKLVPFLKAVAHHVGLPSHRDALVFHLPTSSVSKKASTSTSATPQPNRVPISTAKQLTAAKDAFWNGSANHLRVIVDTVQRIDVPPIEGAGRPPLGASRNSRGDTDTLEDTARLDATGGSATFSSRGSGDSIRSFIDALPPGEELQWTPMRSLGSGAFGQVYEALTTTGRLVAVKHLVIPSDAPACMASSSAAAEELISEIKLLKRLRHRHIVEYYGCQTTVQENGTRIINIFLEHCHGGSINTLRNRFDKQHGRLSCVLVRNYIRQVLLGLEYLHRKGVVHRDIKGDNVLIGASGDAKLADFGCSKQVSTSLAKTADFGGHDSGIALPGGGIDACKTLVGTPLFMAPEILKETTEGYSSSADVWSVGCLVLELFGRRPWLVEGSLYAIMYAVATSGGLPTGMPQECPPSLQQFLAACFDRDPAKRPSCSKLLKFEWMTIPDRQLVEPQWVAAPTPKKSHA